MPLLALIVQAALLQLALSEAHTEATTSAATSRHVTVDSKKAFNRSENIVVQWAV